MELLQPVTVGNIKLIPRNMKLTEIRSLARHNNRMYLTGYGYSDVSPPKETLADLAAALTFAQQRWADFASVQEIEFTSESDFEGKFSAQLSGYSTRQSTGSIVLLQNASNEPSSLETLLNLCMARLQDAQFEEDTGFRRALYRHVESWRLRVPYMDLTYYLDFSALEILCREDSKNYDQKIAALSAPFLRQLGFTMAQSNSGNKKASFQTYAALRNGLFHNGQLSGSLRSNGVVTTVNLVDYEDEFRVLVPLVLLKIMGFDDGHINWNSWLDRQRFK